MRKEHKYDTAMIYSQLSKHEYDPGRTFSQIFSGSTLLKDILNLARDYAYNFVKLAYNFVKIS